MTIYTSASIPCIQGILKDIKYINFTDPFLLPSSLMLKYINLTSEWVITSWRTLFIFRSKVFTAVQSWSISLKGRDSMPPPSSRPVKGHSTDGLPASWLTRGYLASPWSTSFDSFRDRFLVRENRKVNTKIWKNLIIWGVVIPLNFKTLVHSIFEPASTNGL